MQMGAFAYIGELPSGTPPCQSLNLFVGPPSGFTITNIGVLLENGPAAEHIPYGNCGLTWIDSNFSDLGISMGYRLLKFLGFKAAEKFQLTIFIFSISIVLFAKQTNMSPSLIEARSWAKGAAVTMLLALVAKLGEKSKHLGLAFKLMRLRAEKVRISFSSLVKIEIEGHILLVKGGIVKRFQPPGGVQRYDSVASSYISSIGFKPCPDTNSSKGKPGHDTEEFRLVGPASKVVPLIAYYEERKHREGCPAREFIEELVKTKILNEQFSSPCLIYKGYKKPFLEYSKHLKIWEIKASEIYELKLNEDQKKFLKNLLKNGHPELKFADTSEIETLGFSSGDGESLISPHASWLFLSELDS